MPSSRRRKSGDGLSNSLHFAARRISIPSNDLGLTGKPVRIYVHVQRPLHVHYDRIDRAALRAVDDDGVGRENLVSGSPHAEGLILPSC
eukprot:9304072-Pyramimonas_sp.AAC.1